MNDKDIGLEHSKSIKIDLINFGPKRDSYSPVHWVFKPRLESGFRPLMEIVLPVY